MSSKVSGAVKWFDPSNLSDVLLHVTCLRHGGFLTAYEGACVVCEVVRSPRGLQAVRICSIDDSTAIRPSQLPQRTRSPLGRTNMPKPTNKTAFYSSIVPERSGKSPTLSVAGLRRPQFNVPHLSLVIQAYDRRVLSVSPEGGLMEFHSHASSLN